jgi:hypothetical protein
MTNSDNYNRVVSKNQLQNGVLDTTGSRQHGYQGSSSNLNLGKPPQPLPPSSTPSISGNQDSTNSSKT